MTLSFKEITVDNFIQCVRMKVNDDQNFVAPNVFSIAQSKVEPQFIPMAIYNNDTMVGFLMYELDYKNKKLYLCRFMIDPKYQHMGYGKGALEILKEIAMKDPDIERMELSTSPENAHGIKVYEKFGFKDTGVLDGDEEVFVLDLQKY